MSVKDLIIESNNISVDDILAEDDKSSIIDVKDKSKGKKKKDKSDKTKKYVPKQYTDKEKKEMLEDYLLIKKENWYNIPLGSHVRYEKNDKSFIAGGYVKRKWKSKDKDKIYLSISKSPFEDTRKWVVDLTNVSTIYKRLDDNSRIEINRIRSSLLALDTRIKKIERTNSAEMKIQREIAMLKKENEMLRQQNERLRGSVKKTNSVVSQLAKYISKGKK